MAILAGVFLVRVLEQQELWFRKRDACNMQDQAGFGLVGNWKTLAPNGAKTFVNYPV